jgi:hypothetical protein
MFLIIWKSLVASKQEVNPLIGCRGVCPSISSDPRISIRLLRLIQAFGLPTGAALGAGSELVGLVLNRMLNVVSDL